MGARDDNGEPMSDEAVQDESLNFIAAGAETTSNLITWLVYRLVTEPQHWQTVINTTLHPSSAHVPSCDVVRVMMNNDSVLKKLIVY